MADSFIRLPADSDGKRVDTEQLSVGGTTVQRERDQIAGTAEDDIAVVTDTDPSGSDHGLVVRDAGPVSVQTSTANSTSTAAGSSDDIDSTQISSSKTGKLMQLVVSSSVPFKAVLSTVTNNTPTTKATFFSLDRRVDFVPITKEAITVAHDATAGFDGFRITATNLDTSQAADIYATFVWDEV